jgi:undecaprenyl-diphosphatase
VMLHTGTMFAVIVYFWRSWRSAYFASSKSFQNFFFRLIWATLLTGIVGEVLKKVIERTLFRGAQKAEIELLFSRLDLIAPALAAAGLLILFAGILEKRHLSQAANLGTKATSDTETITFSQAAWMGVVQGLALPFRGFSRSGSTISIGMLVGAVKEHAERFSFAMAVVLTPAVVGLEALRLEKSAGAAHIDLKASVLSSLLGMVFSFFAGLLALKWLSSWLEKGRWYLFGIYCLLASGVVWYLHTRGF